MVLGLGEAGTLYSTGLVQLGWTVAGYDPAHNPTPPGVTRAESSPFRDTAPEDAGMMHQELIAKLRVPLGELWNLTDLVADSRRTGRWDALVVVKPLNLVGGVGSPPNAS